MIKRKETKTQQATSLQKPNTFGFLPFLLSRLKSESRTFFEHKRYTFCELVWKGVESSLKIHVPNPKETLYYKVRGQRRSYFWQALRQTKKK